MSKRSNIGIIFTLNNITWAYQPKCKLGCLFVRQPQSHMTVSNIVKAIATKTLNKQTNTSWPSACNELVEFKLRTHFARPSNIVARLLNTHSLGFTTSNVKQYAANRSDVSEALYYKYYHALYTGSRLNCHIDISPCKDVQIRVFI